MCTPVKSQNIPVYLFTVNFKNMRHSLSLSPLGDDMEPGLKGGAAFDDWVDDLSWDLLRLWCNQVLDDEKMLVFTCHYSLFLPALEQCSRSCFRIARPSWGAGRPAAPPMGCRPQRPGSRAFRTAGNAGAWSRGEVRCNGSSLCEYLGTVSSIDKIEKSKTNGPLQLHAAGHSTLLR